MNAKRFATAAIGGVAGVCIFACATVKVMGQPKFLSTLELKPNSCGTWTQERNIRRTQAYEAWVLGFLSGANGYADFGDTDILKGVDTNAVYAWIDNYCKAHPLDNLSVPATELVRELLARAKAK